MSQFKDGRVRVIGSIVNDPHIFFCSAVALTIAGAWP